jgi:hypothetical protein
MKTHQEKVKEYLSRDTQKYALSERGTWRINGEDPNCDFGGCHSQPYLATVTGTYKDVIDYAVELANFWTWGGGGTITKVEIIPVKPYNETLRQEKLAKLKHLESEILKLKSEL